MCASAELRESTPNAEGLQPPRLGVRIAVAAMLATALLAALALSAHKLRPVALADVAGARLPCVSYAPFRRAGHTPFDAALRVSPTQIEADLRLLATVTGCVRTYGLDHGLDAVPGIARGLGLRVMLGAWIGRDTAANEAQLERALALVRENSDVVDLLIVGNEVLLRRELPPAALTALLARAGRESSVPVGYADVWEFWLRHAAVLGPHVHRVVAHVLPYWEDEPVGADRAVEHVHAIAARLRANLAPLPVWVGETGWPAEGRQRGPATPGRAEQARFVRELLASEVTAADGSLGFNLIEGFDQPWKRQLEGAMGGYWGLFRSDGVQRVPLAGAMRGDERARGALVAAAIGASIGVALGVIAALFTGAGSRRPTGWRVAQRWDGVQAAVGPGAAIALGGAGLGLALALQWHVSAVWVRYRDEAAFAIGWSLLGALCVLIEVPRLAKLLAGARTATPRPGVAMAWRAQLGWRQRLRAGVWFAWLFGAAWLALPLVFDGRYRPLVWPMAVPPALVGVALVALGERLDGQALHERLLAAICGLAAAALLFTEGLANHEVWLAAASGLAIAAWLWPPHRAHHGEAPEAPASTQASADIKKPAAATPAE